MGELFLLLPYVVPNELLYVENGALLGWLLDPQNRQAEIYRVGQAPEILINPLELLGEQILPGFVLNLREIWDN
jgi:Uma2 family endonuclease